MVSIGSMEKKYFIQDLEKLLGVNRYTYFYWEETGKVPKAKRTPMGNYRYWIEEDIKKLKKMTGRE
ncbi:MAG: MerR family transcriptional regulator [Candidatus Omnitrophota bacterium]|nr:MerR family transcriptional regulator [Candidatus Omnitrophota bacterium]